MTESIKILNEYFGYKNFRKGQQEVISCILEGRDILSIMPTGSGKSLCYQIPALILDGITIVISPLISLMKDQVDTLKSNGINASFLNSTLDKNEQMELLYGIKNNEYKIIYIAPERLLDPDFISTIKDISISQLAIDEAHCVSSWGHDFRVSYKNIVKFLDILPYRPIVTAFTATASNEVREDILKLLKLKNPQIFLQGFDRENLELNIIKGVNKTNYILNFIEKNKDTSGIIYCATRKEVDSLHLDLNRRGINVGKYHAGMSDIERKKNQEDFINDSIQIIIATNAFGMGIDKPNIRFVIHNNMPQNIESYYQEIGRAGRDGEKSKCILLFSPSDILLQKFLIESSISNTERKAINYKKLQDMITFIHLNSCYRKYILNYFGDELKEDCNFCSNCLNEGELVDRTIDAQKVISCIHKMKRDFGITMLVDVLRGSKNKKIRDFSLDNLSTYGIMKEYSKEKLTEFINILISYGYIHQQEGAFPTLKLNNNSIKIVKNELKVIIKEVIVKNNENVVNKLYNSLKSIRREISLLENVPPYVIFGDKVLQDMSITYPITKDEFLQISGVTLWKYEKYGERFLQEIQNYINENNIDKSNILKNTDNIPELDILEVESDKELYEKLRNLRKEFAKKENISEYRILAKEILLEISARYPTTSEELKDIKGMGPKKINSFGKDILDLIVDYKKEKNININFIFKGKRKVIVDGEYRSNFEIAISMLQEGYKINDVFDKLEVSVSSILGYVTDYIEQSGDKDFDLNLRVYFNDEDEILVMKAIENHGMNNLNTLKKELPPTIKYETIRAVILNKYYSIA